MSGWEPTVVTRYEYEEATSFTSSARWHWLRTIIEWAWTLAHPPLLKAAIEEREPEWSRADVEALLALKELQRVGPHGQPMVGATSPLADPSRQDREWRYEVDVYTDFAARELERAKDAYKREYGDDADLSALTWVVRKVDL